MAPIATGLGRFMGCVVRIVGILCALMNEISIKQVDAPESSKAWDCIEVD